MILHVSFGRIKHALIRWFIFLRGFSKALGMEINWHKSCAYRFDKHTPKSIWLNVYNWK